MSTVGIVGMTFLLTIGGLFAALVFSDIYMNRRHLTRTKGVWEVVLNDGRRINHKEIKTVEYWDKQLKSDVYQQPTGDGDD
jgi:hypothetical protein